MRSLLTFFDFDKKLWVSLKKTNPIERINKELKRRTKSMGTLGERTLEIVVAFVALRIEFGWNTRPIDSKQLRNLMHVKTNTIESVRNEIFN